MQVHDLLMQSAERRPEAPLVWDQGEWTTYSDLLLKARRLARFLAVDCALPKGSRVALSWTNGADAIVASFGVWIAGCVLVSLNTDLRDNALVYQIDHSGAAAVIVGRTQVRHFRAVATRLGPVKAVVADAPVSLNGTFAAETELWSTIVESGPELEHPVRTIDVDLASIVYTSGSTGEPKGVMLTHLNLVSNMRSIAAYLRLDEHDRIMVVLPHFYIYGLSLILTHVLVGGSIVVDNRFMYPNTVLETMLETKVTGFAGVPSTFSILLSRSTVREQRIPSLRYVTQAGGAMPPAVQREVVDVFAPARLYVMYGATEAAPRLSYLEPDDLPRKWGSIGRPIDNVDLFVADAEGNRLPIGAEGELVARGSNIMPGYWRDPNATAEVLRDGLYFTGDLGVADDEGFLFVTGRVKDVMKVKGYRVSPREIEEHLMEIDGVDEAAVVGVPDELLGEAPVAFIGCAEAATLDLVAVRAHLQRKLPAYKVPVRYEVLEYLPKNPAGKIRKQTLKTLLSEVTDD